MNLVLNCPQEAAYQPGKDLSVVISCEDPTTVARACEALEIVGRLVEAEGRLIFQWWNFEVLAFASLRKLASREAAAADLIIISAHGGRRLTPEIANWINQWLKLRNNRPGALMALLDSAATKKRSPLGVYSQLKNAAKLGHLDFFPEGAREGQRGARAGDTKCRRPSLRREAQIWARRGWLGGVMRKPATPASRSGNACLLVTK